MRARDVIAHQLSDSLQVIVEAEDGRRFRGAITEGDLSGGTAKLICEFPRSREIELAIDDPVTLVLHDLHGGRDFVEPAKTVLRLEDQLIVRYGFLIGSEIALVYSRITDWRMATRVRPFAEAPVEAHVHCLDRKDDRRYPVTVRDISATGLGLHVPAEHEPELYGHWRIGVELFLPRSGESLNLVANIVQRRPASGGLVYGVDFDANDTAEFDEKQAQIRQYVIGHQVALLYSFRHGGKATEDREERSTEQRGRAPMLGVDPHSASDSEEDLAALEAVWSHLPPHVCRAIMTLTRGCSKEIEQLS